jgi:hypothetical protein
MTKRAQQTFTVDEFEGHLRKGQHVHQDDRVLWADERGCISNVSVRSYLVQEGRRDELRRLREERR